MNAAASRGCTDQHELCPLTATKDPKDCGPNLTQGTDLNY